MNEVTSEMKIGDTVSTPEGVLHNAVNIGTADAIFAIPFSVLTAMPSATEIPLHHSLHL